MLSSVFIALLSSTTFCLNSLRVFMKLTRSNRLLFEEGIAGIACKNPVRFQFYIFDTRRNLGKQKSYDSYLVTKGPLEDEIKDDERKA